jgi:hypothetical protein
MKSHLCLSLGLLLVGAAGCGSDDATCAPPPDVAAVGPVTAENVTSILERSCALGGCHLGAPGSAGLVLGRTTAEWRAAMVSVPSRQNPALPLIAPGDPARSWLVAKIYGAFCDAPCDQPGGCGGAMPPGVKLSDVERATIVAWIADGAQ